MTRFIVVRHGNSLGNFKRIFLGHTDWGLSEIGEEQAKKTTEYLNQFHIDKVYSSDLSRAYDTVLASANARGLKIHKRKALREIFAGEWEAQNMAELPVRFPESFDVWRNDIGKATCDGGESLKELYKRVKTAMNKIAKENDGKTVLIGTHATVIRTLNCIWHNDKVENLQQYEWPTNASVSIVEYLGNDRYNIIEYGYDKHLEGIITKVPKF